MKKVFVLLLMVVLLVGLVSAADGWGEFVDGENVDSVDDVVSNDENAEDLEELTYEETQEAIDDLFVAETASSGESSTERTQDFYTALWIGGGALFIFLLLLFLLLKRPRNKWKKR